MTSGVRLHYADRAEYRQALHEAIRGLERARVVLAGVSSDRGRCLGPEPQRPPQPVAARLYQTRGFEHAVTEDT